MTDARAFLDSVQHFADGPLTRPASGWSLGTTPDPDLAREAAEIGLSGITVPAAFGGQGHTFGTLVAASEILAAVDFGFAMSVVNTQNVALRLCLSAPTAFCETFVPRLLSGATSACTALTEPEVGSDFASITTRATEADDGWRISGEKTWIVNGRHAGLAVVFAQSFETGSVDGIGGFLVDLKRPEVRRYPIESGFSQGSMGTGGFVLDNVPAECLLLPPGGAFKSILAEINAARSYVAAMCNAMLDATIRGAADYGARRESFGKPLDQHAAWRQPLGAAQTELAASRALTAQAVARVEAGEDAQLTAAEAKIAAVEAGQRHIPQMLHAMGAAGLMPEYCFTRHLAAVQIAGFTDGTTSILRDRVARLTKSGKDNPKR